LGKVRACIVGLPISNYLGWKAISSNIIYQETVLQNLKALPFYNCKKLFSVLWKGLAYKKEWVNLLQTSFMMSTPGLFLRVSCLLLLYPNESSSHTLLLKAEIRGFCWISIFLKIFRALDLSLIMQDLTLINKPTWFVV
jgi:hypothetical protein